MELKDFSINIEAKSDVEVIEEMKQKEIFLVKRGHWDYDVTVSSMSDEEGHELDDDEFVPTSKRGRSRKSRRRSGTSGTKSKSTGLKSTKTISTVTKSRSTRSTRSRTAEEVADEETRRFLSEFVSPVIGLEDCADQSILDSVADDEEVIVTLDVDELEKMLPKPLMESLDPLLCLTPSSQPLPDAMNPINSPPTVPSTASSTAPSTASSSTPAPPKLKAIPKPKPSPVSTNEVEIDDSKVSSASPVESSCLNRSSRKGSNTQLVPVEEPVNKRSSTDLCNSGQSKKSKAVSDFESQLNSIDSKKVEKKPKSTKELMREVRRRTVGEEAAQSTQQKHQQPASLPVEQVVKPDIIKLEKRNVGMLVDPKAKKESSSLSSLKEKLREARMRNMPVESSEDVVTDPVAVAGMDGDGGGDGWEDDGWNDGPVVPRAGPVAVAAVTPTKPTTKHVKTASGSKVNKSTTIQSMGKRSSKATKPLAGQSGQNSAKKSKYVLKPLALSGFRIPKKVASKEISCGPSENLEDEWGTPFQPEPANTGSSSGSATVAQVTIESTDVDGWD